eukprot:Pgem_evm1s3428
MTLSESLQSLKTTFNHSTRGLVGLTSQLYEVYNEETRKKCLALNIQQKKKDEIGPETEILVLEYQAATLLRKEFLHCNLCWAPAKYGVFLVVSVENYIVVVGYDIETGELTIKLEMSELLNSLARSTGSCILDINFHPKSLKPCVCCCYNDGFLRFYLFNDEMTEAEKHV